MPSCPIAAIDVQSARLYCLSAHLVNGKPGVKRAIRLNHHDDAWIGHDLLDAAGCDRAELRRVPKGGQEFTEHLLRSYDFPRSHDGPAGTQCRGVPLVSPWCESEIQ